VDTLSINWFLLQGNVKNIEEEMHPDDVTIVNNPSRWRKVNVGCRVMFKNEEAHSMNDYLDRERTITPKKGNSTAARRRNKYYRFVETLPQCALVIDLHTVYQVSWQDGTVSDDVPSTDLIGYDPAGVNEFWPNSVVCRAAGELDTREVDFTSWGIVLFTDMETQMVTVKWISKKGKFLTDPVTESVSLYSLIRHPDYNNIIPEKLVVRESDGKNSFQEVIGEVVEIVNGKCSVCWLNGTTSEIPIDKVQFLDDEVEDSDCEYDTDDNDDDDDDLEEEEEGEEEGEETAEIETHQEEDKEQEEGEVPQLRDSIKDQPSYPALQSFPRFGAVTNPPDNHHYLADTVTLGPRQSRAVIKDWGLLENNLPEGVFIRSFESHLDLLQVLIIGPKNTPYHDSVFMFDVGFPYDYPKSPPAFYFHSVTGEQINPNLYPTGSICLSLLGTWNGEGVEVWNPGQSSLLQVILSIQGLILGQEEPYFLEAGFEKRKGTSIGNVHSLRYNPTAILGSLKHSLKSYQLAKANHYTPELNEIICKHIETIAESMVNRIDRYLDFAANNDNPKMSDILQYFNVPLEGSAGFNQELKRYRDLFTTQFLSG